MATTVPHVIPVQSTQSIPSSTEGISPVTGGGGDRYVPSGNSLFGLVRNLTAESRMFLRQEIKLAKTEVTEKVGTAARNGASLGIGGSVAYAGAIVLLLGLGFLAAYGIHQAGIDSMLAGFLGLLGIGMVAVVIGVILVLNGISRLKRGSLAPQKTLQTLQDLRGGTSVHQLASEHPGTPKPSSEEMQQLVKDTEARMSYTLDELGRRLDPAYINARMKHRIQENPYRAGLIAVGAGLISGLMLTRRRRR